MLEIQQLRKEMPQVVEGLLRREYTFDEATFSELEAERKSLQVRTEELQATRNAASKQIGILKSQGQDTSGVMAEVAGVGDALKANEVALSALQDRLNSFLRQIPNIPRADVPAGKSADENIEVRRWGAVRSFDFAPKDHTDIGEVLKGIDFETATKLSGARFSVLRGQVARLHRAIAQFMLDTHTEQHGYTEVYVPYMVGPESADGVSSLAKFKDDLFKIEGRDLYLIPTAEYPVTNFVRDTIVDAKELPLKFACHSPCFRSEAGSYGKDTRGMIRQHQFDKVELVQIITPEKSTEAHEELTTHAEAILQKLELPYRKMLLCTGDMGFASAKTYDLEVWLPAQNAYREISSCSNFEAFQARRMMARFKNGAGKTELLHTVNGSGLAVGRTLVAILENYQDGDGSVSIPTALQPYMGGLSKIGAV
ncbi:MAG: serine--tRNA ligase [Rhodocyclaceae bacterium]|jgi:seryl-tRNA synthetase|nr:serine--tRNA ligase [Rhodocyclaceae bacterium]MCE2724418.1 serine--tRNA ligase [Betaproteobacteria bacterium]MCA3019236.1 serine--tRNA ligase [Rhodocyclaceae bacterium]MCA3021600.1 serine--tRNA ligase [Rhodocyclaceae bacterium]MCA3024621.1 serine--tRNA ligase [Rhodocyclaceae bacterium]